MRRLTDGKVFAMKQMSNYKSVDRPLLINEANLLSYLRCDEINKCFDVYDYEKSISIILELMDQSSMFEICTEGYKHYSEDFCRYSLYKVARGLLTMHNKNVVHRDIKSLNVLFNADGKI